MPNVTLSAFNTIPVAAASGAYRLTYSPPGFARSIDLMNLGPGSVFIRTDATSPTVNDPVSLTLAANWAVNKLNVDSAIGLSLIAAADTTISVRLT
jgi:hypothetical protein